MSSSPEPRRAGNVILIGKKPLMTYVTATLVQLASEPTVIVKARGKSIARAVWHKLLSNAWTIWDTRLEQ